MGDFVDAKVETVAPVFGDKFALLRMDLLNKVVQFLQKRFVVEVFRPDASESFARKPAALVVGVEDLEIASFDFDDQPHFFRKLELVPIVLRSAVDKGTDVD